MGTLRDVSQHHTFISALECDVWCKCGNQYGVFLESEGVTRLQCSRCGRRVSVTVQCDFDDTPPLRGVPNE